MNKFEQGVLQAKRPTNLPATLCLLLTTFYVTCTAHAESTADNVTIYVKNNAAIIYSPNIKFHAAIAKNLSAILVNKKFKNKTLVKNQEPNLVIAIGKVGTQTAKEKYPEKNKLFISSAPEKNTKLKNTTLHITQPYCRQLHFIKLLNKDWKTVSLLNSQKHATHTSTIQQCSKKHGIKIYTTSTGNEKYLTDNIKNALNHSDALLALPDKTIYNSKTVKNILLTSYRYRKPIIAFSQNFTNAGALASIHSSAEQIAQSASMLIEQYYRSNHRFKHTANYPHAFDISLNRQVFRALNLSTPDPRKLKQTLQDSEGKRQ